ncbi:hypothetical protein ACJX0J_018480, partial [Zea mays]
TSAFRFNSRDHAAHAKHHMREEKNNHTLDMHVLHKAIVYFIKVTCVLIATTKMLPSPCDGVWFNDKRKRKANGLRVVLINSILDILKEGMPRNQVWDDEKKRKKRKGAIFFFWEKVN